jgi:hypothetical protein
MNERIALRTAVTAVTPKSVLRWMPSSLASMRLQCNCGGSKFESGNSKALGHPRANRSQIQLINLCFDMVCSQCSPFFGSSTKPHRRARVQTDDLHQESGCDFRAACPS